jgi:hypothetical protein
MYQGRTFGSTFGVGALSGQLTSKTGGELPTQSLLVNIVKINVVADDSSIEIFGVEFVVFFGVTRDHLLSTPTQPQHLLT